MERLELRNLVITIDELALGLLGEEMIEDMSKAITGEIAPEHSTEENQIDYVDFMIDLLFGNLA